jgi:hypothetical protein
VKTTLWILWPAFLVACVAELLFFSLFDPVDFQLFGPLGLSRRAGYSIGFLLFWSIAAASSALTCFLQRSAAQVNRPGIDPDQTEPGAGVYPKS